MIATDRSKRKQKPVIKYAGNPPFGRTGWFVTIASSILLVILFLLTSDSVRAILTAGVNDSLAIVRGWVLVVTVFIVAVRIFTVVFPPRAHTLWRNWTEVGKYGRKFARTWRRIIPGLTPVSTGLNVRRHYPGLVSATEENNQLILTIRFPNERPSGGLKKYAKDIAEAFQDAYGFASVIVQTSTPRFGYNCFRLAITPSDRTEEAREWNEQ